jgi:hypothetical protein
MDTTTTDDITHRLHRFAIAVQETHAHASECSTFGRFRAGAPYFEQYPLRRLLDSCEENALVTRALWDKYRRINADLTALEREGGRQFREDLFCDLSCYTDAYRAMLCWHELGCGDADGIARLREDLAILLLELEGEFRTSGIRALIASLDIAFRSLTGSFCTDPPGYGSTGKASGDYPSMPAWQRQSCSRMFCKRTGFP